MKQHAPINALAAALLLCAPFAHAQEAGPPASAPAGYIPGGRIPQLPEGIVIDGKLEDAGWQGALVQEVAYDIQPGDNTPAPVKTTVRSSVSQKIGSRRTDS